MNYDEFEMIMNKLNVSFLALGLYSDYFSQDFYEESGIYKILDNNVDLLTLFFRNNDRFIRDEIFDCLSTVDDNILPDSFEIKVANIYDKLQESNRNDYLTQDDFYRQMDGLISCLDYINNFKVKFGDNGKFIGFVNDLIETNLDLLISLTNDKEEILYNTINNYKERNYTKDGLISIYNELIEEDSGIGNNRFF